MKRIITSVLFGLLCTISFAQVTWNAKAGMNISSYDESEADAKIGYRIGGGFEYQISKMFSIQPSLFYSKKGAKMSEDGIKATVNQNYLELPVMAALRLPVNEKMNIVLSAGPYMAYGVGGKTKLKMSYLSIEWDTFGNSTIEDEEIEGLKRFDAGIGVGVALEVDKWIFSMEAQNGLTHIASGASTKNTNVFLGVGYKF